MNYEGMSYTAMMATRTYRVIRSTNPPGGNRQDIVEATGLAWDAAAQIAARMQKEYNAQYPGQDSWTADLFMSECENCEEINKELELRRIERTKIYDRQSSLF